MIIGAGSLRSANFECNTKRAEEKKRREKEFFLKEAQGGPIRR
jgi:hypothetical protein